MPHARSSSRRWPEAPSSSLWPVFWPMAGIAPRDLLRATRSLPTFAVRLIDTRDVRKVCSPPVDSGRLLTALWAFAHGSGRLLAGDGRHAVSPRADEPRDVGLRRLRCLDRCHLPGG